jgi:hypothetical protein
VYDECLDDITVLAEQWGLEVDDISDGDFGLKKAFDLDAQFPYPKEHVNLIAMWCMMKKGDMRMWPWYCDEARGRTCPGVTIVVQEDGTRIADVPLTTDRNLFAPFLLEQLGFQAFDLDSKSTDGTIYQQVLESSEVEGAVSSVKPTPKLLQTLDRLACRAAGGCCPSFNNTDATSLPRVDPVTGMEGVVGRGMVVPPTSPPTRRTYPWAPTDTRETTDCQKVYLDHCTHLNGGVVPALIDGTGLYTDCPDMACRSVASGACVHSPNDRDLPLAVSAMDFYEMVEAEDLWAQGQLYQNCNSGFDFATHTEEGREYFMKTETTALCRTCTEMVPVGAFECSCKPGWGWDDAPARPRSVSETSTGKAFEPDPPIASRVGVDNCDFQQNNCWNPDLDPDDTMCMNEGTCKNKINDYECECVGGWEGKQCDQCEGMFKTCQGRWMTLVGCVCALLLCALAAHKGLLDC